MVDKYIKRIWFVCLCLTSLSLVGCFHVPDEDWLPSRNKVETTQKDNQVEETLNSFIDSVDMISSQRDEMKDNEEEQITYEELDENTIEIEDGIVNNGSIGLEIEDDIISEG